MAESELSITYGDLLAEVAAYVGYGVDDAAWTAAQLAELDRYVQAGVRRFYYPPAAQGAEAGYQWSFLQPVTSLSTAADDAAQDLPDGCGRVLGGFHFDETEHRRSIVQVSEDRYQSLLSRSEDTGPPQVVRIRHKAQVEGEGQKLEAAWWPIPDATYVLTYRYEAYSGKLDGTNVYPLGGMRHAELLIASCLAVAEQRANDEKGIHSEDFGRMLVSAIQQDRRLGPRHFGAMGDHSSDCAIVPRHGDTGIGYDITYKGDTY